VPWMIPDELGVEVLVLCVFLILKTEGLRLDEVAIDASNASTAKFRVPLRLGVFKLGLQTSLLAWTLGGQDTKEIGVVVFKQGKSVGATWYSDTGQYPFGFALRYAKLIPSFKKSPIQWRQDAQQVDNFRLDHCKAYLCQHIPADLWKDAQINEVIEYLYSNKELQLTPEQKEMVRGLSRDFAG
ncbi:unnamed protein product, partial [Symbiodinium necroappetens]